MLDPDNKIDANSTWEPAPRKQWQVKFIASVALFGFLAGMMIGRLLEGPQQLEFSKRVVQIQNYTDGLAVCLTDSVQVQTRAVQGTYQVLLLTTWGQATQGEILLSGEAPVRWQLQTVDETVQVTFIGLQALQGQWHPRLTEKGHWCADIELSLRDP